MLHFGYVTIEEFISFLLVYLVVVAKKKKQFSLSTTIKITIYLYRNCFNKFIIIKTYATILI